MPHFSRDAREMGHMLNELRCDLVDDTASVLSAGGTGSALEGCAVEFSGMGCEEAVRFISVGTLGWAVLAKLVENGLLGSLYLESDSRVVGSGRGGAEESVEFVVYKYSGQGDTAAISRVAEGKKKLLPAAGNGSHAEETAAFGGAMSAAHGDGAVEVAGMIEEDFRGRLPAVIGRKAVKSGFCPTAGGSWGEFVDRAPLVVVGPQRGGAEDISRAVKRDAGCRGRAVGAMWTVRAEAVEHLFGPASRTRA